MTSSIVAADLFCGAGGSSTGVYRDKDTDDVGPCPFCWEEG